MSIHKFRKARSVRLLEVRNIIKSKKPKKIVVGGPGSGKSYLFETIALKNKNILVLSFVNALVEDLSLKLYKLSEVRTLHSLALSVLGDKAKIFPKLPDLIAEDTKILLGKEVDFKVIFNTTDGSQDKNLVGFYKQRKDYYDKHYGFPDLIYAAVKYLESERSKIPAYNQVIVDEFQDFNYQELRLIDLLSEKSPVLLAGDDDQALYVRKGASPSYIRERYKNPLLKYKPFKLSYCSRCPRVIVDAVNDITNSATKKGYLKDRINDKDFIYHEDRDKNKVSDENSKIIYSTAFDRQIPDYISNQISQLASKLRKPFSVLIISPTNAKLALIVNLLKRKGFKNISQKKFKNTDEINILDGFNILLKNKDSNLGWRIVMRSFLKEKDFKSLMMRTNINKPEYLHKLIGSSAKKEILKIRELLKKVNSNSEIDNDDLDILLKSSNQNLYDLAKTHIKDKVAPEPKKVRQADPAITNIQIKATTIEGSKGLAEEYVFVTHFDDIFFSDKGSGPEVSDTGINKFIVAITRARTKVFLISTRVDDPTFLKWIKPDRIQRDTSATNR